METLLQQLSDMMPLTMVLVVVVITIIYCFYTGKADYVYIQCQVARKKYRKMIIKEGKTYKEYCDEITQYFLQNNYVIDLNVDNVKSKRRKELRELICDLINNNQEMIELHFSQKKFRFAKEFNAFRTDVSKIDKKIELDIFMVSGEAREKLIMGIDIYNSKLGLGGQHGAALIIALRESNYIMSISNTKTIEALSGIFTNFSFGSYSGINSKIANYNRDKDNDKLMVAFKKLINNAKNIINNQ